MGGKSSSPSNPRELPEEFYPATPEEYDQCKIKLIQLLDNLFLFPEVLILIVVEYVLILVPVLRWEISETSRNIKLSNEGITLYRGEVTWNDPYPEGLTHRALPGWNEGRHLWSLQIDRNKSNFLRCGFVTSNFRDSFPSKTLLGDDKAAVGFWSGGLVYDMGAFNHPKNRGTGPIFENGTVLTFCLDLDNGDFYVDDLTKKSKINFRKQLEHLQRKKELFYHPAVSIYPGCQVTLKVVNENQR